MRIPNSANRGSTTFNMTPMIDVVFLLIIFFLVSSHLARQDALELDLPDAESALADVSDEQRIIFNVLEDGTLMMGGTELPGEQIESFVRGEVARRGNDIAVRIRGSRSAPFGNVEPIMVACAKAGVWNVSHAVYRDSGDRDRGQPNGAVNP